MPIGRVPNLNSLNLEIIFIASCFQSISLGHRASDLKAALDHRMAKPFCFTAVKTTFAKSFAKAMTRCLHVCLKSRGDVLQCEPVLPHRDQRELFVIHRPPIGERYLQLWLHVCGWVHGQHIGARPRLEMRKAMLEAFLPSSFSKTPKSV